MNHKRSLIIIFLVSLFLLSSCVYIPAGRLDAMFRPDENSEIISGHVPTEQTGDTVTISREEYEKIQKFSELFEIFDEANQNFYVETDTGKMVEYATKGLMAGLDDPYSFYYNPEEFAELWEDDEGNYTGIGVMISANMETQICTISRVFKGSPAETAGVQRGDVLYRVGEDLFVTATNLQEAVDIMRGIPGTDVDVTFLRNGEELTFTITRKEISVNQIESKMLSRNTGYIALYQFAGQCEIEFEKALNDLVSQGAQGIISGSAHIMGDTLNKVLFVL